MTFDEERRGRRNGIQNTLLAAGLWGLVLVMLPHLESYSALAEGLSSEVGKALVVAAVLGFVVDRALKHELVRDAVSAALGYLLPPQLRDEMDWVYGQKVIAKQTWHITLDHRPEHKTVIVRATVDRILRNITGQTAKVRVAGGTDDWFNPIQRSEITTAEYRKFKDGKYGPTKKLPIKRGPASIGYGDEELVNIGPDELIHVAVAYTLPCPDHGQETLTYRYPIENPEVQVEVPETLRGHISMSHREPSHAYPDFVSGYLTSRLNGTLLPHQDIHVQWHRADDLK